MLPVSAGGPESIVVSGGSLSGGATMVHMYAAGIGSTWPTESVARTSNTCWPTARPVYWRGEVHGTQPPLSSWHSNVAASLAENSKIALVASVELSGPESTVVSGGVSSTIVQAWLAGVGSTLPASSTARTSNVCSPGARVV